MSQDNVVVGRLGRAFGVKGWQHLQSFTSPSDNLLSYQPWFLRGQNSDRWQAIEDYEIQNHNDGYLVRLAGVDQREESGPGDDPDPLARPLARLDRHRLDRSRFGDACEGREGRGGGEQRLRPALAALTGGWTGGELDQEHGQGSPRGERDQGDAARGGGAGRGVARPGGGAARGGREGRDAQAPG